MPRHAIVVHVFQFLAGFVTLFGSALAIRTVISHPYTLQDLIIFILLFAIAVLVGKYITITYLKLLGWVLQHLTVTENQKWVVAFGTTAVCDVFLVTTNMTPVTSICFLSSIMICVVAAGWDRDRSGMTEGFLIGFGKLLLVNLIREDCTASVMYGSVLFLAIVAKFTENAVGATPLNPPIVGHEDSSHRSVEV
uniref:Pollen S n=1 Tax=Papaver rhoeas TaxID=33128 RepID=B3CJG0_PAPRH|nr:papaver rhoeas pollen S [Papaver rhoeas]